MKIKTAPLICALALAAAVFCAFAVFGGRGFAAERPLTLVELYTSQGCSSCPPADAVLGELSKRDDVLALSIHVDYWDYIGWKDPFAAAKHGDRQRDYASRFSLRYVYTPQMVVHGAFQAVGSDRGEIEGMIDKARALPRVAPSLTRTPEGIEVALPETQLESAVEVISVFYDRREETKVRSGENRGKTLVYHNVVKDLTPVALWRGAAKTIAISKNAAGGEVFAVILQLKDSRRVIGVARLDLKPST